MSKKRSLIIVAHGSRHASWNQAIVDFTTHAQQADTETAWFQRHATAFMELAEPGIPETLHAEAQRSDELIVMPLFLTVSKHLKEDVPTEVGKAATRVEELPQGARYALGETTVWLLNPPPAPGLLSENVHHRTQDRVTNRENSAGVLVLYGTKSYQQRWDEMARQTCDLLSERSPGPHWAFSYGGDSAGFSPEPLINKINTLLAKHERVFIVPGLVGVGVIQREVIPAAVERCNHPERVQVFEDAILPDPALAKSFLQAAHETSLGLFG